MDKIDAHQHFWHYRQDQLGWINDQMEVLKQHYLPPQLSENLNAHGINGSVAVQAQQTEAETRYLLKLSEQYSFIRGVVGWVDLQSPELKQRLEYFAQQPVIKGFRHIVQDEPDDNFMLRDPFLNGISQLESYGFTYDILIYPRQLGAAIQLASLFPQQKFVLDHLAKPNIKDSDFQPWAGQLQQLAQHPNIWCKLSGLITEAHWNRWSTKEFQPYLLHAISCFGPERVMFGSDWPVCLLAGSYQQVVEVCSSVIEPLSVKQQALVWGGNAMEFYGL